MSDITKTNETWYEVWARASSHDADCCEYRRYFKPLAVNAALELIRMGYSNVRILTCTSTTTTTSEDVTEAM